MRSAALATFGSVVLLCAASICVWAGAYHGVDVGQRDDFLPPEFDQVKRGEYRAQFGNERMQVFVDGAEVTGFKVWPLAPMTLAEAVAAHSPGSAAGDLQILLDFNRTPIGVADVGNRIAYFTHSYMPEAIVRAVGHYNEMTEVQVLTTPMPGQDADNLAEAAARASARALNSRPKLSGVFAQAEFLVERSTDAARRQGLEATEQLRRFTRLCQVDNAECEQSRAQEAARIVRGTQAFLDQLAEAERVYAANSAVLENPPEDLTEIQEMADSLVQDVRAEFGPVQFDAQLR